MLGMLCLSPAAQARITPAPLDDPAHWATVTHAGNAPNVWTDLAGNTHSKGSVDHEYRISRTEVTTREWFEFVQAYAPFIAPSARRSTLFFGSTITWVDHPDGSVSYTMPWPGLVDYPADMGWRYAARYCNWLHNGKVNAAWAFETGAYDTSTFGNLPGNQFSDQQRHSPDARFWISTEDEWYKAAYFDPARHGPGLPGYWMYPTTSDTAPVGGPPGVGQTSSYDDGFNTEVGAYTSIVSPWGLWDLSGNNSEWMEDAVTFTGNAFPSGRIKRGSFAGSGAQYVVEYDSALAPITLRRPDSPTYTFRLVTQVPAPGTVFGALIPALSFALCRRSRSDEGCGPSFSQRS